MTSRTILVVGANRGIGFELAKQLSAAGHHVHATYRTTPGELETLDGVTPVGGVDIGSDAGVAALDKGTAGIAFDDVIVVSGVLRRGSLSEPNFDDVALQLNVNSVGPLRVAVALNGRLAQGGRFAILTSRMGSIADNGSGGMYGYRMSKAAVNAAGMSLARDLAEQKIAVALLHPGFVRTEMTGGNGHIDADESARLLIERVNGMTLENTGTFWHANGEVLPW
ncbi:MAG: SDR family oxidoreductase [Myxococcota bacterium]